MTVDTRPVRAFLEEHHTTLAGELLDFQHRLRELPAAASDDECRRQAREILGMLGDAELCRVGVGSPDLRGCCLVREALAASSPLADEVFALQCLGSMPLTLAGTPELQERWLPQVVSGRAMAAFAMTEAEAGSDVVSMATTATREGDRYRIHGEKCFISNAGIADLYTVFAVTDREAGHRGISCFLVESGEVEFVEAQVLSAPHPLGRVRFDGSAGVLIGAPGEGFKLGMATLDRLRATVGAAACGMAARALEESLTYARRRKQFGKALAEFQLVQQKLAMMATELVASRLLVYRAAWEKDLGADRVTLESAMAKAYACEAAQRVVDEAVQIHGGAGCLAESVVDHLYRAVRALRIYEGTTEIQHLVIARHLLR